MAGLWSAREYAVLRRAPAVWPCACPCALLRPRVERFDGPCVGRPAVLDPVGWGTPPPTSPRAADGPGGELRLPDCALTVRCAEPVRSVLYVLSPATDLAENRWCLARGITAPTTSLEGALVVFGERFGAHSRRSRKRAGLWISRSDGRDLLSPVSPGRCSERRGPDAARAPTRCCEGAEPVPVPRRPGTDRRVRVRGSAFRLARGVLQGALRDAQAFAQSPPHASFVAAW